MNAYLSYWKPEQVDWDDPSSEIIDYSGSQQYHKVRPGDQVYILTSSEGKMFLVGRILVDDVVGRQEAATRLGYAPEYEADYYILPPPGTAAPAVLIECENALRKLYSVAADGQPERIKEPITGQRFRAMRKITPVSATILDDVLASQVLPVKKTKNPPWSREELLLALELYMRNRKSPPSKTSRQVESLSEELNRLRARIGSPGSSSFRNANGVYLKMMNFRSYDPDYTSQGKVGMRHGNKLDSVVWNKFFGKEDELFKACRAIREALKELSEDSDTDLEDDGFAEAAEGKLLTKLHKKRERSGKLANAKKKWAMKKFGGLNCEACGFNFATRYGERGQRFIECHHTQPVHEYGDGRKTTTEDLALLCANCHRIIHTKRPWLRVEELKALLR